MKIRRYVTNDLYVYWQGGIKVLMGYIKKYNPKIEKLEKGNMYYFNVNGKKEVFFVEG